MISLRKHIIPLLALIVIYYGCTSESTLPLEIPVLEPVEIKLKSDYKYAAGQPIAMMIYSESQNVMPVEFVIYNGLNYFKSKHLTNKKTILGGKHFKLAGLYDLIVLYRGEIIAKRKLVIKAGQIIEPLNVHVGPSSIIVGSKQPSMLIAIPTDKYDNGITSKKKIEVRSKDGNRINTSAEAQHLIASHEFRSEDISNKIILGATYKDKSSREKEILETPDWASPYQIETVKHYPFADNRQYLKLRTSRIKDSYGNQISDGSMIQFHCYEDNQLTATYQALVIDGIANVYIKNPNHKCSWKINSSIGTVQSSNELKLEFQNNLEEILYAYDDFLKELEIGPLKSSQGQLIPDGTIVTLHHNSLKHYKETENGIANFKLVELGLLTKDRITISVAGLHEKIQL